MNRPSHKELNGKLNVARQMLKEGRIALLNQISLADNAIELDYAIENELSDILIELLGATTPKDYTGSRPPQRSYEWDIQGLELFAFVVDCDRFKYRIYFKFALGNEIFWLVSLHQDRPKREEP